MANAATGRGGELIPVLGIPVLNRGDLLLRCVRSIDFPVGHLLIINNGSDQSVLEAIRTLSGEIPNLVIKDAGARQLGVAGSWNAILHSFPASYYLICSSDIQFKPGDLEMFRDAMINCELCTGNHGYAWFGISHYCYTMAGTFDENFHPAYFEDNDYDRRIRLLNLRRCHLHDAKSIHGEHPHWGSSTIKSDPALEEKNHRTHRRNRSYYESKWGGLPHQEKFDRPFNDPDWPVPLWKFDPQRREGNQW